MTLATEWLYARALCDSVEDRISESISRALGHTRWSEWDGTVGGERFLLEVFGVGWEPASERCWELLWRDGWTTIALHRGHPNEPDRACRGLCEVRDRPSRGTP